MRTSLSPSGPHSTFPLEQRLACALIALVLFTGAAAGGDDSARQPTETVPAAGIAGQSATRPADSTAGPSAQANPANQATAAVRSPLVNAVITMADAGVSTAVIQAYVEATPSTDPLTPDDIILLKQHKVADEVVTTLLNQSAKARAQIAQRQQETAARAAELRQARYGGLDPDSYEYFHHYYLQPRAMASAYRRLSPYATARGFQRYYYCAPGFEYHPRWR
jgi:hypothetical protein